MPSLVELAQLFLHGPSFEQTWILLASPKECLVPGLIDYGEEGF